jgi:two-component system sensor histidine kinase/response regulator
MQADKERCLAAGMNGFVSKPINPEDLWSALQTWIRPRAGMGLGGTVPVHDVGVTNPSLQGPVLAALRQIHGLDVTQGLSLSNQNAALYVAMLGKFAKSQEHTLQDIRQALADANGSAAERLAHTLKGLSASIGAEPLHQSMVGIEQSLHDGDEPAHFANLMQSASSQLQRLVADLRAVAGVVTDGAPLVGAVATPQQQGEAQRVVHLLHQLLEQDDAEAQALWDSHARALHSLLPHAQELERAIQGFDFEEALRLLSL